MKHRGFSAIELIGVLAVLAILTALLLPRISRKLNQANVLQTVNEAHVVQALASVQSLQGAVAAHLAQFGSLGSLNGTPLIFDQTYDKFAQVLLTEGLIERPFDVSLGTSAMVRLVKVAGYSPATAVNGTNGAYDLDGDGKNDVLGASFVAEAVLPGVNESDAKELNDRVDGPRPGATGSGDDLRGRVIYRKAGPDGRTEVHVFIMQGR